VALETGFVANALPLDWRFEQRWGYSGNKEHTNREGDDPQP
jgi:hypothetical protein